MHRDISADNIMVVKEAPRKPQWVGRGMLLDWEMARTVEQLNVQHAFRTVCLPRRSLLFYTRSLSHVGHLALYLIDSH